MAGTAGRTGGRPASFPGGGRRAPVPAAGRAGRLDRQRHVRHRHDDRRRHRPAPHRRGDGCLAQHRIQPPADLRRRGDGPALRLSRADGVAGHGGELGDDPGAAADARTGQQEMCQAVEGRPGQRPPAERGHRRRGRAGPRRQPDHRPPDQDAAGGPSSARTPGSRSSATCNAVARPARSTAT